MRDFQYYDGLNKRELVHDDSWLIVIKEAAEYCKSRGGDHIRFNHLKERSDEALSWLTGGARYSFGGTFESIVFSQRCKKYLRVVKISPTETQISPYSSPIDKEFEARRAENSKYGNKRLVTLESGLDHKYSHRIFRYESSIQISDGLHGLVTYANKRKEIKII